MDDDPEISSWLNQIISKQKKETSSTDFFSDHKRANSNDNEIELEDNEDLDLNFFKKYRKGVNAQLSESDKDDDEDVDISHFFQMNDPIEIKNDDDLTKNENTINPNDIDTLNEARRLLSSWAEQTESFQVQGKQSNSTQRNSNLNNRNNSSPNRVVQYRKLEMPMMVAKKQPELKVNDPTLKMEERLKHVREMREKRLEKQKLKQIQSNTPQRENIRPRLTSKVPVPDIDSEIRSYRSKMNENLKEKQKEIEDRERRMRRIENEVFLSPQTEIYENNNNNSNIQTDKAKDKNKSNRKSSVQSQSKNVLQDNNIRKKASNNKKSINKININDQNKIKDSNTQNKNHAENDTKDERVIQMRLQVFIKNEVIRQKRYFFAKWIDRCRFQTQAFKKAAVLANFRLLSKSFSFWNQRLHTLQQKRELEQLESKLRERKSKEQLILSHFRKSRIRKFFSIWRIKYKTQLEFQIAEARKKKRLEIVALQLNSNNNNRNNPRNKNPNQHQQNNADPVRRITVRHSTQPNHHFNKHPNQDLTDLIVTNSNQSRQNEQNQQISIQNKNSPLNSPSRNNPQNQPRKVKKIKIDPKIEAMEKRSEEQKQKRLEKLQKKAEEEKELKERKLKEEEEKLKKKRIEHLKELEKEKKIREDERKKQIENEKAKERLKYITEASEKFRDKMVEQNAFREWKKIIQIKKNFNKIATNYHSKKLKQKVFLSFQLNANLVEKERTLIAHKFYTKHLKLSYFNHWFSVHEDIKTKERKVDSLHRKMLLKSSLHKMSVIRKERKKKRFLEIQNALRIETMRRVFKAWTVGCAAIREDEEREEERNNLLSKALQYLDEISSDDI